MTKQEFDLKYRGEKVAVHCDTEEKAKAFLSLANSFGYRWTNGWNLGRTNYDTYGNQTVYFLEYPQIKCGRIDGYCKENNYKIIPFELDEPKETFNVGDVVYVKKTGNRYKIKGVTTRYILDGNDYTWTAEELTHQKPLKEITEKELADMGFVLKK